VHACPSADIDGLDFQTEVIETEVIETEVIETEVIETEVIEMKKTDCENACSR
jgi:hypothetical protein